MEDCYEHQKNEIRAIHESYPRDKAIEKISDEYRKAESLCDLAEARIRMLLIGNPNKPELGTLPNWAEMTLNKAYTKGFGEAIAEDTEFLIRAVNNTVENLPEGTVEYTDHGIEVDWNIDSKKLKWVVKFAKLPWPGIYVRAYYRHSWKDVFHAKTFRTCGELLEHFKEMLKEETYECDKA